MNKIIHLSSLGYGVYKYENSFFRYEGEWKEGKKHGKYKSDILCVLPLGIGPYIFDLEQFYLFNFLSFWCI